MHAAISGVLLLLVYSGTEYMLGRWQMGISQCSFFHYGSFFRLLVLSDVYVEVDRGVFSLCMWLFLGVFYGGGSTLVRIKTLCLSSTLHFLKS